MDSPANQLPLFQGFATAQFCVDDLRETAHFKETPAFPAKPLDLHMQSKQLLKVKLNKRVKCPMLAKKYLPKDFFSVPVQKIDFNATNRWMSAGNEKTTSKALKLRLKKVKMPYTAGKVKGQNIREVEKTPEIHFEESLLGYSEFIPIEQPLKMPRIAIKRITTCKKGGSKQEVEFKRNTRKILNCVSKPSINYEKFSSHRKIETIKTIDEFTLNPLELMEEANSNASTTGSQESLKFICEHAGPTLKCYEKNLLTRRRVRKIINV